MRRVWPWVLAVGVAAPAHAHGLFGHVHVTGWAVENLPAGELQDFFADPDVRLAALTGAAFPDTGYALGTEATRDYGEHAHWEPFIEDMVQYIRTTYGPTYDTPEEKKLIAFVLGAASHGLQDEMFDSTFLFEAEQRDPAGDQSTTDPGTDGFLCQDGHARLYPNTEVPTADLLPQFARLSQADAIDAALLQAQMNLVVGFYVNDGVGFAAALELADQHRPGLPWVASHYLDPSVPGAHRAEILPTMRHMQALWDRLHGRDQEGGLVVHRWPEPARTLREADADSAGSWVTLVLGKGVVPDTATATFTDAEGRPHPFQLAYTRWGGVSRIVRFQPTEDLVPGAWYVVTLEAGATLVDGTVTTTTYRHAFQVACTDNPDCGWAGATWVPEIEPGEFADAAGGASKGCAVGPTGASAASGALALAVLTLGARRRRPTARRTR
jgi:MYXO-CTERM domain-containing protein